MPTAAKIVVCEHRKYTFHGRTSFVEERFVMALAFTAFHIDDCQAA